MNVYVATKFEQAGMAREVMTQVEELGHQITYDWTKHFFAGVNDVSASDDVMAEEARRDYLGVIHADTLLFIQWPGCMGAWAEVGMAIARSIPVIIIGKDKFIFDYLPDHFNITRCDTIDEALKLL